MLDDTTGGTHKPDPRQLVPPATSADQSLACHVAEALAAATAAARSETGRDHFAVLGDRAAVTLGDWVSNNVPGALEGLREAGLKIWSHRDGFGDGLDPTEPPLESLDLKPGEWFPPASSAEASLTDYLAGDFAHARGRRLSDLPDPAHRQISREAADAAASLREWIATNAPAARPALEARGLPIDQVTEPVIGTQEGREIPEATGGPEIDDQARLRLSAQQRHPGVTPAPAARAPGR